MKIYAQGRSAEARFIYSIRTQNHRRASIPSFTQKCIRKNSIMMALVAPCIWYVRLVHHTKRPSTSGSIHYQPDGIPGRRNA